MTYSILIGDRSYSSWSLRGWLLFEKFGIHVEVQDTRLYHPDFAKDLEGYAPTRTVPAVKFGDGCIVSDSLAIAETLAEMHPEAGLWPAQPKARALARSIAAEMHSSFSPLRSTHPMNLRNRFVDVPVTAEVQRDLDRIETLWSIAFEGHNGPWLFGEYSIADVMFAPVAARIFGYDLPVGTHAQRYVRTVINDPTFNEWRIRGLQDAPQPAYDMPYETQEWTAQS
ncbi:MAG: glutathione S-transferase [Litoreibacter sp.]